MASHILIGNLVRADVTHPVLVTADTSNILARVFRASNTTPATILQTSWRQSYRTDSSILSCAPRNKSISTTTSFFQTMASSRVYQPNDNPAAFGRRRSRQAAIAELQFAGRIGGNQGFTVSDDDEKGREILKNQPDAVCKSTCFGP